MAKRLHTAKKKSMKKKSLRALGGSTRLTQQATAPTVRDVSRLIQARLDAITADIMIRRKRLLKRLAK